MRTFLLGIALLSACAEVPPSDPTKTDADADGWPAATDCDDADPLVNPSAEELCDAAGLDEDCDGGADDADPEGAADAPSWYPDQDGDGYAPEGAAPVVACAAPAGHAGATGDCDDARPAVSPGATEVCDAAAVDEDCDGLSDDADPSIDPASLALWYPDADHDGYGDSAASAARCVAPEGYIAESGDCDDRDELISPDAQEKCDPDDIDEDCDGGADDADTDPGGEVLFFEDADGDGYGGDRDLAACDLPEGYADNEHDCDDTRADVSPAGWEVCDDAGADEDCDTLVDDADDSVTGTYAWVYDEDGDGYGGSGVLEACVAPPRYYATSDDCNDFDPMVSPGGQEVCDEGDVDEDCDGLTEDDDSSAIGQLTWYQDLDGDEWGTSAATMELCEEPAGYAPFAEDCDDDDAGVSPGEVEVCGDGVDQDCDGEDPDCPYAGSGDPESDYDFKIYGAASGNEAGMRLAGGDFDADGVGDLLVAASSATYRGTGYGVVYGFTGPFPTGAETPTISDAFLLYNVEADSAGRYGELLTNVGDQDGDGTDDIVVGDGDEVAWLHYSGSGTVVSSAVAEGEFACTAAAAAGDFDPGSGGDDWLCGSGGASFLGTDNGTVVAYAGTTSIGIFVGEDNYDGLGTSVAAGDVNGDGVHDAWIGAYGDDGAASNAGAVYLVYGPPSGGLMDPATEADAKVLGASGANYFGTRAASPGDLDGDGYDDLVASAPFANGGGTFEGKVYVFTSVPAGSSSVTSSAAATIVGENNSLFLGSSPFAGGDVDGDGVGDLLLGATLDSDGGSSAGAVWLLYGPHTGSHTLTSVDASWRGDNASDALGTGVALVPDTDGDGDLEIAIGASAGDHGAASDRGAAWVLDGR